MDILVPQPNLFPPCNPLQFYRRDVSHRAHDLIPRVGPSPKDDLLPAHLAFPPCRHFDQPQSSQLDQGFGARTHLVVPRWSYPIQVFANGLHQLGPAQPPKQANCFLDVFDFLGGELAPGEEGWWRLKSQHDSALNQHEPALSSQTRFLVSSGFMRKNKSGQRPNCLESFALQYGASRLFAVVNSDS